MEVPQEAVHGVELATTGHAPMLVTGRALEGGVPRSKPPVV
jgi:hypothetical protein